MASVRAFQSINMKRAGHNSLTQRKGKSIEIGYTKRGVSTARVHTVLSVFFPPKKSILEKEEVACKGGDKPTHGWRVGWGGGVS